MAHIRIISLRIQLMYQGLAGIVAMLWHHVNLSTIIIIIIIVISIIVMAIFIITLNAKPQTLAASDEQIQELGSLGAYDGLSEQTGPKALRV